MRNEDLNLITLLEKKIGRKLVPIDLTGAKNQKEIREIKRKTGKGYILDKHDRVIELYLEKIPMYTLPETLTHFTHLKTLSLYGTRLKDYSLLSQMKTLSVLDISYSDLKDISFLEGIPGLTELDGQENRIVDISPLQGLKRLKKLNLRKNLIKEISPLKELENLEIVDISDNAVDETCFSEAFVDLKKLKYLDLRNNKLKYLPEDILKTGLPIDIETQNHKTSNGTMTPGIYLEGNPIQTPPLEIIKRGNAAEEFNIAFLSFLNGKKPGKIYVYFKNAPIDSTKITKEFQAVFEYKEQQKK